VCVCVCVNACAPRVANVEDLQRNKIDEELLILPTCLPLSSLKMFESLSKVEKYGFGYVSNLYSR
jgi:hypothetical protein